MKQLFLEKMDRIHRERKINYKLGRKVQIFGRAVLVCMDFHVLHWTILGLAMAEPFAAGPKAQQMLRVSPLASCDPRARDELPLMS